jgi:hypothetical protein
VRDAHRFNRLRITDKKLRVTLQIFDDRPIVKFHERFL